MEMTALPQQDKDYTVSVFLNETEDEDGRLAIFTRMRNEHPYRAGDTLREVWTGSVPGVDTMDALETTFAMFNRGSYLQVPEFTFRSLSVGDVVEVNGSRYFVDRVGFLRVP